PVAGRTHAPTGLGVGMRVAEPSGCRCMMSPASMSTQRRPSQVSDQYGPSPWWQIESVMRSACIGASVRWRWLPTVRGDAGRFDCPGRSSPQHRCTHYLSATAVLRSHTSANDLRNRIDLAIHEGEMRELV